MSNGGISSGALDSIITCGFISRSYLSNCFVVLLFKTNRLLWFDRAVGGNPILIFVDRTLSMYWSTESQNILLVFGLVITGVIDGGKPENSSWELYWTKSLSSFVRNGVIGA